MPETIAVRFDILLAYAEGHGLDFEELCRAVRDAIVEGSAQAQHVDEAFSALQAVEDWWLTQADKSKGAPACIFMVREALAQHRRTAVGSPPIFVANDA